ncbi:MAG: hypothetical protein AAF687_01465 [Pseudomonadota bacterium]
MIDPKWLVIGGAAVSLSLIFNYNLRLGVAASALFVMAGVIYLVISYALARVEGEPASGRETMFKRVARLERNRRAARKKELSRR